MPLEGLKGKKALVTGAASGIGHAVAERLKSEGVEVFPTDIHPAHGVMVADLTDADDVERLSSSVSQIDFLINVAGGPVAPTRQETLPALPKEALRLEDIDETRWSRVLAANLTTAFLVCREFAPRMKARKFGRIVNFASIAARRGSDRVGVHYAAAKGGIIGLTKTLALELGPHGITVNAIAPGFIETEMIAAMPDEVRTAILAKIPMGRFGRPEEIAQAVVFLVSHGDYITGQAIEINGGMYT